MIKPKTAAWHAARRTGIGGSDANVIMAGDDERLIKLWQEKRGEVEPEDLSGILPVIMGEYTEALNRHWFTLQTGRIVELPEVSSVHATIPHMRANLDGICGDAVWEAKHVNQYSKMPDVLARYMPQLTHNMLCAGFNKAILSVFIGTLNWECVEITLDPFYADALIEREAAFWLAVTNNYPPVDMRAIAAPVPPEKWRTVDMTTSNSWAMFAGEWLDNKAAAKTFKDAAESIKALVESDVGKASAHGVVVSRSKTNALTIKETK